MSLFKGKFKNHRNKLGLFVLTTMFLVVVMILLFNGISLIFSIDPIVNKKLELLFSHLSIFLFPTIIFSYLYNFDLRISKSPDRQSILLAICIIVLAIPAIECLHQINQFFFSSPEESSQLQKDLLQINSLPSLFLNLFIIAILPALSEEFLFRGVLQQKFLQWISNPHLAICLTAFLFSVIHLDAGGILPRFLLGILLGYLFFWSKNLWLSIIVHFINNAIIVTSGYLYGFESIDTSKETQLISWQEGLFSFFAVTLLLYLLEKNLADKRLN